MNRPRERFVADGSDEGQVMLLMIFFAVIIAGLITVIVDVSTVFLAQRELQSTADGAALAAAQQADVRAIYTAPVGAQLPLSAAQVLVIANSYASNSARIPHECSPSSYRLVVGQDAAGNERTGLQADGSTVRIELTCRVPLPFVSFVARAFTDGVTIDEVAYARTAVTPNLP
jgi:Flp pilus assembly protein TadG